MSKDRSATTQAQVEVPKPVNVVDGIPDRAANGARWKRWLIVAAFLAWLGFLLYCQLAGNPQS